MKRISPPKGVYASPVATPGTLVRCASSGSKRRGPRVLMTKSRSTLTLSVRPPTISAAMARATEPMFRSRLRTPASRV